MKKYFYINTDKSTDIKDAQDDDFQEVEPSEKLDDTPAEAQDDVDSQDTESDTDGTETEDLVSIGDEVVNADDDEDHEQGTKAPPWVTELRKEVRTLKREKKERERLDRERQIPATQPKETLALGNKPKIDDFDYDSDAYEAALDGWYTRKQTVEAQARQIEAAREAQTREWQQKLSSYEDKKTKLKVRDFEDAEAVILENLSEAQQGIILNGADNPALLVYALGKNEAKAKELAKTTDLVKFAFNVAKLESQLKVTQKRIPEPEKVVGGSSASPTKNQNSTLEKLEAEALRTGDRTKVIAFKRQMFKKE